MKASAASAVAAVPAAKTATEPLKVDYIRMWENFYRTPSSITDKVDEESAAGESKITVSVGAGVAIAVAPASAIENSVTEFLVEQAATSGSVPASNMSTVATPAKGLSATDRLVGLGVAAAMTVSSTVVMQTNVPGEFTRPVTSIEVQDKVYSFFGERLSLLVKPDIKVPLNPINLQQDILKSSQVQSKVASKVSMTDKLTAPSSVSTDDYKKVAVTELHKMNTEMDKTKVFKRSEASVKNPQIFSTLLTAASLLAVVSKGIAKIDEFKESSKIFLPRMSLEPEAAPEYLIKISEKVKELLLSMKAIITKE